MWLLVFLLLQLSNHSNHEDMFCIGALYLPAAHYVLLTDGMHDDGAPQAYFLFF